MEQKESRKEFLKRWASLIPSIIAIGFVSKSCNSTESRSKDNTEPTSCDDMSGLSKDDLATRKKFNYVEASAIKNKSCKNCNLFIPSKSNSPCGKCMLFKGPVQADGHCTYWAPLANGSEG